VINTSVAKDMVVIEAVLSESLLILLILTAGLRSKMRYSAMMAMADTKNQVNVPVSSPGPR